ncbi:AraC family transcriptional regulator [Dyadobacter sp. LJ53]|uniref:AraC family transcriptional regulator n=1 Tax=Dyadobacter chenwenxiniae TaxID=2906456 RepID=UPI001F419323|nr:AraC family transcriptional regulator [Dyadobacter chenwenxiniae]MCF0052103.1 AraC family transcriptional regulator [Dyadobacter chenwenxiniae]
MRNLIYAACARGANLQRACEALGILVEDLHDAEMRIDGAVPVIKMWNELEVSTGDPCIGLHVGLQNNPSVFGLLGYLMQSCHTMKDTYSELQKYQKMLSGWISYKIELTKSECEITFGVNPLWSEVSPETARHGAEAAMSASLSFVYVFTGQKIWPLRAELVGPANHSKAEYERIFNCHVSFEKEHNRLIYDRAFGDIRLLNHDESLYAYFGETIREKTSAFVKQESFCDQVRQIVMRDFMGKIPSLEVIAAHMNMSERSFQRKLRQHNESYRSLGTAIKKDLAFSLLRNTDAKVHSIAEVLGYAEPSAFHRAFKSWTKTTPTQKKSEL